MEPSGPLFRVQFDGQPVVLAALGNVILVEFVNVAVSISAFRLYQDICLSPTWIWHCGRYAERYGKNKIASKSKREEVEQHRDIRLAVKTV